MVGPALPEWPVFSSPHRPPFSQSNRIAESGMVVSSPPEINCRPVRTGVGQLTWGGSGTVCPGVRSAPPRSPSSSPPGGSPGPAGPAPGLRRPHWEQPRSPPAGPSRVRTQRECGPPAFQAQAGRVSTTPVRHWCSLQWGMARVCSPGALEWGPPSHRVEWCMLVMSSLVSQPPARECLIIRISAESGIVLELSSLNTLD